MTVAVASKLTNQTVHEAVLTADQIREALGRTVLESLGPVPPDGAVSVQVSYTLNQVQGSDTVSVGSAAVRVVVDHVQPAMPGKVMQVTRRQAIQAMILTNNLDEQVEANIAAIVDPQEQKLMRAWYRESLVFERDRPELIAMATSLGLTDVQVDDLFTLAATL